MLPLVEGERLALVEAGVLELIEIDSLVLIDIDTESLIDSDGLSGCGFTAESLVEPLIEAETDSLMLNEAESDALVEELSLWLNEVEALSL